MKEETLPNQQTVLLDELNLRMSQTRSELDLKNRTIRQQEANRIIKNHVLTGSAIGLIPLPLVDILALSSNQLNMLHRLSEHYNLDFDRNKTKVALTALLSGSLPTLTLLSLSSASKFIPGIGTLGGNASLSLFGGAVTYATGQSFAKHFDADGTLDNFHARKFTHFFKQELQKGQHIIQQHLAKKTVSTINVD
ncbi:MAG: Unknown protein [uncultured Thiotrichaceae bacterium]|uniref:GTPase n=1 Tax=uncultured Thiotrichaceae bacterium TaxID=298394 RepID=A0A6S6U9I1_9GAMM|nr:MAG: Unknown protein [uncultured Thiotrichaceae bacterium]